MLRGRFERLLHILALLGFQAVRMRERILVQLLFVMLTQSHSPARAPELPVDPQLAKTILLQPNFQIRRGKSFHLGFALMLLAHHHHIGAIGHRIHQDVRVSGDDDLGALRGSPQ